MEKLKNRVALVTGSAQGMGYAIARCLLAEGAKVLINDLNQESIERAVKELNTEFPGRVMGKKADVTNKSEVQKMIAELCQQWGTIDILVNNAGGALHTPYQLAEIEEKHWDLVLNVNLKGSFFTCQAAIPVMVKAGKGAIVNMSALAGHWRASLAGVQYTAAKAGVEGLTRQLAYDWGHAGIRINAVAPTVTITGERVKSLWDDKEEEEKERIFAQIPLKRLSTPEEIGKAVVFLASDEVLLWMYVVGAT
jgi:NAD(P)-dependent dehydrogenase (short-subunit alcohol dehydrogenase family)